MLEQVKADLENYKQQYRKTSLPHLQLSEIYALFPDRARFADEVCPNSGCKLWEFHLQEAAEMLCESLLNLPHILGYFLEVQTKGSWAICKFQFS